jgi:FtsH-binding integral membrane protein
MGVSTRPYVPAVPVRTGAERATLVRRTYALVFAGVLVTMAGVALAGTQPALMELVLRHPFLSAFAWFIPLIAAGRMRGRPAAGVGLMFVGNLVLGAALAPMLFFMEQRQPGLIAQTALLTGSTFAVLTGYAFVSRRDFSAWGGFLTVGLWVLIGTSLLNLFFRNVVADLWIAGVGTLLFSGLLVFDTWRLRNVYGPDDYVPAAIQIYLDLVNLFLFIFRLLGGRRD